MKAELHKEHEWLQKLVGDWTSETDIPAHDGHPATTLRGTETFRSLKGAWVVGEGRGPMPGGGDSETVLTLGYDPDRKRFVGTWIGSMMNFLWIYDGELDASGRVLTLGSEGPAMDGTNKIVRYQDVTEFLSDDHRTLTGKVQKPDGSWDTMMVVHYHRKK